MVLRVSCHGYKTESFCLLLTEWWTASETNLRLMKERCLVDLGGLEGSGEVTLLNLYV